MGPDLNKMLKPGFQKPIIGPAYGMLDLCSISAILTNWDNFVIFMVFDPGNLTTGVYSEIIS